MFPACVSGLAVRSEAETIPGRQAGSPRPGSSRPLWKGWLSRHFLLMHCPGERPLMGSQAEVSPPAQEPDVRGEVPRQSWPWGPGPPEPGEEPPHCPPQPRPCRAETPAPCPV